MAFDTPDGPFVALKDINLKIRKGEFVSLIGHSGCGKSTVLNIVAGLLQASQGGCVLDGHEVNTPGPERAVVFQNHALMPWLTVYENVELAVKQVFRRTMSRAERRDWIHHNLALVNMQHAANKRPGEISGGMAQRVGIARALAMKPSVLLMDEPFGALDALTRAHLQDALMEIQQDLNSTVIMITHDVDEAVLLSDRIVMMTNGPAAGIGEELSIELPRPRNRVALADHPDYVRYRQSVLSFLYEKQTFPGKGPKAEPAAAPAESASGSVAVRAEAAPSQEPAAAEKRERAIA
ncbi:ABC transporter ATP-binding protein [Marinobacter sp.]|uniref:ABC transporter ATP-binding protein n=1 Tax=Marinobacter sp. TaxID=50741 RepID=UPI0039B0437E